jgi:RNA polymerase sigma factor (TIGR02999 family)
MSYDGGGVVVDSGQGEITQLLARWEQGDAGAVEALAPPLVYDRLRGIAEAYLRNERLDHTLQPTAVVNEVFLDLLRLRRLSLKDRAHLFTFAAQLTRRVLIDSARQAKSAKRGFGWQRAPRGTCLAGRRERGIAGSFARARRSGRTRSRQDAHGRTALLLRLHGDETAELLGISTRTVERSLRFSLAWLRRCLA